MPTHLPRFEAVTRRHLLALGGLGAVALLDGCGHDDKAVFSNASAVPAGTGGATTTAAPGTTQAPATTQATGGSSGPTTTAAAGPAGPALAASAKLNVTFTFSAQDSGFQVRNPYICVWIEDAKANLVQNLAIWYREPRYIEHLTRWYDKESTFLNNGGTDNTAAVSGATRPAGQFALTWDGTDVAGKRVAQGDYVVAIEAAREHGPYEVILGNVTLGTKAASFTFTPNGELSAASASFVV